MKLANSRVFVFAANAGAQGSHPRWSARYDGMPRPANPVAICGETMRGVRQWGR